jgi:choline kinase
MNTTAQRRRAAKSGAETVTLLRSKRREVVVTGVPWVPVGAALVLAAGNGDRFHNGTNGSKLLQPVLGRPLIVRTLETARDAGITGFEIVLGYQADAVRAVIERHAPAGTAIHFTYNDDWRLENGVSVLAARARLAGRRFALLMGDHLFEARVLTRLLLTEAADGESLLAVDSRAHPPQVAEEATKVRIAGDRIVAIGKELAEYDALDTGLFVCAPEVFAALDVARAGGDTTLTGGVRRLAARGQMRAVDIGDATWHDIDTMADLETAESLLGAQPA